MNQVKTLSFVLLAAISMNAEGQYHSDRPLEMSFEHSDLFFSPSFLNPLGSEKFGAATVLTSDHPLNAIQRNPANLTGFDRDTLASNYFYLDFRNTRDIVSERWGGIYPGYRMYQPHHSYPGWGFYHTSSRSELAPIVSAAWLTRLPGLNNSVSLGATYQLINKAGGYYAIPQNIFRNMAGKTVDGMDYAMAESYDITDRFSGSDDMYHEGHAMNIFLAWNPVETLEIGVKAGRFIFERDGSLGSDNIWSQGSQYGSSYWKTYQGREQEYDHWDYSLGINYIAGNNRLGMYAGMVSGSVRQTMEQDDRSQANSGSRDGTNYNSYMSRHISDQKWDHSGNTIYGGLRWERQVRDDLSFRMLYNYSGSRQELGLASDMESESNNIYYYYYNNGQFYASEGFSDMHDYRTGNGDRDITSNSLQAAMRWTVKENQFFSVGAIAGMRRQTTTTSEKVDSYSETFSSWSYLWNNTDTVLNTYYHKTVEDKTINWEFTSRLRSLQIPVIYEYDINERFELLIGVNRIMNFWKIENQTLILYDYRERVRDEEILIEEMTGERITEPRERLSIISTSLLTGITFSPSKSFSVQLVASPGFEKNSLLDERKVGMQFWLSISLRP